MGVGGFLGFDGPLVGTWASSGFGGYGYGILGSSTKRLSGFMGLRPLERETKNERVERHRYGQGRERGRGRERETATVSVGN